MGSSDKGSVVYMDEPGSIQIKEFSVPSPDPNAIVTDVIQANVCGSEAHMFKDRHPIVKESILGHEAVCRVRELGDEIKTDYAGEPISKGDVIAPVYFQTCQQCPPCQIGDFYLCQNAFEHWTQPPEKWPHFHATFATHYYINPNQYFYKIPEGLDPSIAAGANCALSQVLFGLNKIGLEYQDTVVIQGAGGLGLNTIAIANVVGAETIVIEGVETRLEQARAFGADHVIDFREYDTVEARTQEVLALTDDLGADIAVEVAGVPEAFSEGINFIRDGGKYLEIGNAFPGNTTEFDPGKLTRAAIEVTGVVRYQPWYLKKALDFLNEYADQFPYDRMIDATYRLTEVREAIDKSDSRQITRAALRPN